MAAKSLEDLFHAQLQDAYSAETQLVKALPKMAKAASLPELKAGFEQHLEETKGQVERLKEVCKVAGCKTGSVTCEAMEGLIVEGKEVINMKADDDVRDAGLIIAAQKVEHYEIALYGGLCALAKQLGHTEAAETLHQTLEEEKRTDEKLTRLAESQVNAQAAAAH
jgi:ferritin-like metal-binding protein YciE